MDAIELTADEKEMLAGARGPGAAKAMEILSALARVQGVRRLQPVRFAHVSGISYKNIGEAGLHFLRTLAEGTGRIAVPATLNPGGIDLVAWKELGAGEAFVNKQREIVDRLASMGFDPLLSCAPYHAGYRPDPGDALAWAESSAVAFANAVLGARTQREGGPASLAAAIAGRTVPAGPHRPEGRRPTLRVEVRVPVRGPADAGALGVLAGRSAGGGVPWFEGLTLPAGREEVCLKALGASMGALGAVAVFHADGFTHEAIEGLVPDPGLPVLVVDDLSPGFRIPGTESRGPVDLVAFGCPHASLADIREIAASLDGRRLKTALWVMTSRHTSGQAEAEGLGEAIRRAGGRIVCDTCIVVSPLKALGFSAVATDAAKAAYYLPAHQGVKAVFADRERCLALAAGSG